MPRMLGGLRVFTVSEVADLVGVHRTTLLRWIHARKVPDGKRDRNDWRMFSEAQVELIKDYALSTSGSVSEPSEQMALFDRSHRRAPERRDHQGER
jgi:excisionase family DNA binding protein